MSTLVERLRAIAEDFLEPETNDGADYREDPRGLDILAAADALSARLTPPAEVVLETTAEDRAKYREIAESEPVTVFWVEMLNDHDTLTAALAASEAKRKDAEERADALTTTLAQVDAGVKRLRAASSQGPLTSREIFAMTDPIADVLGAAALDHPKGDAA